jgi:hypothetical protein
MDIQLHLIMGMAIGIEYVTPGDETDGDHTLVIDLVILRVLVFW